MKKNLIYPILAAIIMVSCNKKMDSFNSITNNEGEVIPTNAFVKYTINKGEQFCDKNYFTKVAYETLSFSVRFDSSAIYRTACVSNQDDINKLFGFSDNNTQHHEFSARFGWRWNNKVLQLMAYVYNNGVMSYKEVGSVQIGTENACVIKVAGASYVFSLNGTAVTMPRASTTAKADGYKLYPYFGGDEVAPQTISIWIKELKSP
jgi:hypothetical protein